MVGVSWWGGGSSREGLAAAAQRAKTVREGGREIKSEGRRNGGREDGERETRGGAGGRKETRLSYQLRRVEKEETVLHSKKCKNCQLASRIFSFCVKTSPLGMD